MRLIGLALVLVTATVNAPEFAAAQQDAAQIVQARNLLMEASHLVKDIPEAQQFSTAANIAGQLTRADDLPEALATVRLLKGTPEQELAITTVLWQLGHSDNFTEALAIIERFPEDQAKGQTYETLAELLAEKGDLRGALQIAHRISKDPNRLADTLVRLAKQEAKNGHPSGARETLGEAFNTAEEALQENIHYATIFTQIATAQAEIGDTSDAFVTLDWFSAIAHQYKEEQRDDALLQQLGTAQAQIGDISGALRTVEEISPENSGVVLMCISQEQAKQGLMVEALQNAARISSPESKAATLRQIAIIRGTHGTLNDALEAINGISEPSRRAEAAATLALEQAENKNLAASSTLQLAWELAAQRDANASDTPLGMIAVTRALLNDFTGAQQIVRHMTQPESQAWALWNISSLMVEAGYTKEALALADNQDKAYCKAYALLGTAQGILSCLETEEHACAKKR